MEVLFHSPVLKFYPKAYRSMKNIQPKDLIALVVIIGGFILLAKGIDSVVGGVIIMVTTYYFRKRTEDSSIKKPI